MCLAADDRGIRAHGRQRLLRNRPGREPAAAAQGLGRRVRYPTSIACTRMLAQAQQEPRVITPDDPVVLERTRAELRGIVGRRVGWAAGGDRMDEAAGFRLPTPGAMLDLRMDDGAPIRVVRHGNPCGPRVVLSHGNGFASDSYFPFWRHLLERFDLALFDFRNCGRNPFHAAEPHDYPRFRDDMAAVHRAIADAWGRKPTAGVFHSMSAIAALLAIAEDVWLWDALVLFDPPVVPPEGNPLRDQLMAEGEMLRNAALIRANRFSDPDELAEVFRTLHRFRRLRKGVAELNARSVLRSDPASGAWQLCCPGPVEAGLYTEVATLPIWDEVGAPRRPLLIIAADPEPDDAAKTARCCALFCRTHGIEYGFVPSTSHLMQLEEPEQCVARFDAFLAAHGMAG